MGLAFILKIRVIVDDKTYIWGCCWLDGLEKLTELVTIDGIIEKVFAIIIIPMLPTAQTKTSLWEIVVWLVQ